MNIDIANTIREKVDIVEVIGQRLPLVKKGKNYFGVCPFHDDNNPSMSVSREKQIYKCFSCGASGNVFNFLMDYEHLSFGEVLNYLGDKTGVKSNFIPKKVNTKYSKYYDIYSLAVKYYQNNLNSKEGELARKYLLNRNINDDIIKEFSIGLSLNKRDDLTNLLKVQGYNLNDLNLIGLSSNDNDVFNGRIMFPLDNISGNIVGFSGRIYKDGDLDNSKYMNTKETPIFHKGNILYHANKAKSFARESKSIIVMEGFMDVIRAATIGIRNTVALMGTALTKDAILELKKISNNIILCLDGDEAGINATLKAGDLFLENNIEVKVLELSDGEDPDTYILKYGKDRFLSLFNNLISFNDFKIKKIREKVNFNSTIEKSEYIKSVLKELSKIDDNIRKEITLKSLAKEFDLSYNTLELQLREYIGSKKKVEFIYNKVNTIKKDAYIKAIEQILFTMLVNEWSISIVDNSKLVLLNENYRMLRSEIIYYYNMYGKISIADFYTYINDKRELVKTLNDIISSEYKEALDLDELNDLIKTINKGYIKDLRKKITNKLINEVDDFKKSDSVNEIIKLKLGE